VVVGDGVGVLPGSRRTGGNGGNDGLLSVILDVGDRRPPSCGGEAVVGGFDWVNAGPSLGCG
ncbi:hypothetical protein Dimus_008101, partial [Dionaea muscipula]